jgi:hypothetical protein
MVLFNLADLKATVVERDTPFIGRLKRGKVKIRAFWHIQLFFGVIFAFQVAQLCVGAEDLDNTQATVSGLQISATMCEGISENLPLNLTVLFRVAGKCAYCWSSFQEIKEKSYVYHHWYRKDKLVSSVKLSIQPPRWATYSSIYLRESDKGPWRVDIVDNKDNILKTLRFSITD